VVLIICTLLGQKARDRSVRCRAEDLAVVGYKHDGLTESKFMTHRWAPEGEADLLVTSIAVTQPLGGQALDGQELGDGASPPPTISIIAPTSEKQEKYNDNKNGRHNFLQCKRRGDFPTTSKFGEAPSPASETTY
jgi:hypothetical protein